MYKRLLSILALLLVLTLAFAGVTNADKTSRKIVVLDTRLNQMEKEDTIRKAGGEIVKPLPSINGYAALLSDNAEKQLKQRPGVVRIDEDAIVTTLAKPTPSLAPQKTPWGITRVQAPDAWSAVTDVTKRGGVGVKVGVIDTGISTSHPDLNVSGGVNTINPRKGYKDDNGHGSHVAGIIAAKDNTVGVVGVAPEVELYAIKVLGANGSGYVSDIIEGLAWAADHQIPVVNMSLGTTSDVPSFHTAIINARAAGVLVIAAAGNSGPADNTVIYPARYAETIAVSAIDSGDNIASFSSRGSEVDLTAPGVSIYSTYKGSGFATLSGTSMATPHVTGVAALRLAIDSDKSPGHIASVLQSNADLLTGLSSSQQGFGLVNAYRVVTAP